MIARSLRIFELPDAADILRQVLERVDAPCEQITPLDDPEVVRWMATEMPFVVVIEIAAGGWEVFRAKNEDDAFRCLAELYVLACRDGIRDFSVHCAVRAGTKARIDAFLEALRQRLTASVQ